MTKYKIINNVRANTRVDLENGEHVFVDNKEELIVGSKPINVTFGLSVEKVEEIKEKKKTIKEE